MYITGIWFLDELIGEFKEGSIIELYGSDEKIIGEIFHRSIALLSKNHDLFIILAKEFGGIDPYYLSKLARIHHGDISRIFISRCFRLNDVLKALQDLIDKKINFLILYMPYSYIIEDPRKMEEASKITSLLQILKSKGIRILIFNSISGNGYFKPKGGNFHHHIVDIMIKIERKDFYKGYSELVKHPAKRSGIRVYFTLKLIKGDLKWGGQLLLKNWLL